MKLTIEEKLRKKQIAKMIKTITLRLPKMTKKNLNDKEDNIDQDTEDEDENEYENEECNICSKCRCNKRR